MKNNIQKLILSSSITLLLGNLSNAQFNPNTTVITPGSTINVSGYSSPAQWNSVAPGSTYTYQTLWFMNSGSPYRTPLVNINLCGPSQNSTNCPSYTVNIPAVTNTDLITNQKVGIGYATLATPLNAQLDVNGSVKLNGLIINGLTPAAGQVLVATNATGSVSWGTPVTVSQWVSNGTNLNYSSGKVSIGNFTGNQATIGNYKLYVEGGIISESVKVALKTSGDWSDYVFNNDYKLMSLEETEKFVKTNKHLPGVPSADELVKAGGFDLAKMDAKLLEKVEELTLYLIKQQKEIEELKKEVKKY